MELKKIHMKAIEKARKTMHSQPVLSWSAFVDTRLREERETDGNGTGRPT